MKRILQPPTLFSCENAVLWTVLSIFVSVCLSVTPLSQCSSHRIIMKISGNLDISRPQHQIKFTGCYEMMYRAWNDTGELSFWFSRSSIQVNLALILEFKITCTVTAVKSHRFALLIVKCILVSYPRWQGSSGQYGAHLGPVGPRWAPCWPHEPCYHGCSLYTYFLVLRPNARHKRERWSRTMQWIWGRMLKTWTTWLPRLLLLPGVGGYYNRACCPGGHNWGCYPSTLPWASYQIRKIAGCACARNAGNIFPSHSGLAIPTCITARARRTCCDACRDR